MVRSQALPPSCAGAPFAACDLNAMLAPLDRYGPTPLSEALVKRLIALTRPAKAVYDRLVGRLIQAFR